MTAASEGEAQAIARNLVQDKLAACVNCFPVQSTYIWQDTLQQEQEWQLVIKTNLQRFEALAERVRSLHSYEVPEIIALPILAGLPAYLNWLDTQTPTE